MSVRQITEVAKSNLVEFRIAIFWFCLFSVNSICSAILIALSNATWSELDPQGKFLIVIGIVFNWTGTIMAFVSKQASRIKQTGELFPAGDTQQFTRTDLQQTQITKTTDTTAPK